MGEPLRQAIIKHVDKASTKLTAEMRSATKYF